MNTAEQTNTDFAVPSPLSYPAARLRLGIAYVGVIVLAAIILLMVDLPGSVLIQTLEARFSVFAGVGLLIGLWTLLSLPFDLIGGYLMPRAFKREVGSFSRRLAILVRGAFCHAGFLWMVSAGYLLAAHVGGWALVPVVAVVFLIQQIAGQKSFARLVGDLSESKNAPVESRVVPISFASSREASFSGGIVGWPGNDRIVVAEEWRQKLEPRLYELFVGRRIAAVELGLRRRGVVISFLWNMVGIFGASYLSGLSGGSLAELLDFACITTLWSFAGLLLLPGPTRNAVAAIDRQMLAMGYTREDLAELARVTSDWQDGEKQRPQAVEAIFHPQPSLENRMAALEDGSSGWAAWNVARTTLYLSWSGLGLLSRAVHSNAGRPDLWAMGAVD